MIKYFLCFSVFCVFLFSQGKVDGIVAMVGKNIILHGDVLQQAHLLALDQKIDPDKNPYLFENIYSKTLDNIINQYAILDHAQKDTNIIVSNEEVDRALEERIQSFIQRAGSKEVFESMVGMSLRKIRAEYWVEIKNMMYIEKYKNIKIQPINISRVEIIDFYKNFKDSIPLVPEKYTFSVIDFPVVVGKNSKNKIVSFLDSLRSLLINDVFSFDSLAKIYSKDPGSAPSGGRLGYTSRGSLVQPYEQAAYSLGAGDISQPVQSDFGYHLIKLLDRRGEKISSQHILLTASPSKKDFVAALKNIQEISKTSNNDPFIFDSIATIYARNYNNFSGVFLNIYKESVPSSLFKFFKTLSPYIISNPIKMEESYILILLYEYKKSYLPNLENSWVLFYEYALIEKQNRFFNQLITNIKKETYIKVYYN